MEQIKLLHDYGVHIGLRTIQLVGEIDDEVARKVCTNLMCLDAESSKQITLVMNTGGGNHSSGMYIYDTIKMCKADVNIIGIGAVQSMGAVIMQAGDYRSITKNCQIMLHYGTSAALEVRAKDFQLYADYDKKLDNMLLDIMVERTGMSRKRMHALLLKDSYFTAEEALELNLADEVI